MRIAHVVSGRQLFRFEIDRFLLAAVRAVAHQPFPDHVACNDDLAFAGCECLQVGRRFLGGIEGLEVESSCREEGNQGERISQFGAALPYDAALRTQARARAIDQTKGDRQT